MQTCRASKSGNGKDKVSSKRNILKNNRKDNVARVKWTERKLGNKIRGVTGNWIT